MENKKPSHTEHEIYIILIMGISKEIPVRLNNSKCVNKHVATIMKMNIELVIIENMVIYDWDD